MRQFAAPIWCGLTLPNRACCPNVRAISKQGHAVFQLARFRIFVLLCAVAGFALSCGKTDEQQPLTPILPATKAAANTVASVRSRFSFPVDTKLAHRLGTVNRTILSDPLADAAIISGSTVVPHFPIGKAVASLGYSTKASGAFAITGTNSGATLKTTLASTTDASAEFATG